MKAEAQERRLRPVDILRVSNVTPRMRRLVLGGAGLADFPAAPPGAWIKLFFSSETGERIGRAYTIRDFDAARSEMTVDIVLHGDDGPASRWAGRAAAGDRIAIAGPRAGYRIRPDSAWHLLAGDESALPAIGAILEQLPAIVRRYVIVEVADAGEIVPLAVDDPRRVNWLLRDGTGVVPGALLFAAVCDFSPPAGAGQIFVAGESGMVGALRRHLVGGRGIATAQLNAQGYWKLGEADHRDRDS